MRTSISLSLLILLVVTARAHHAAPVFFGAEVVFIDGTIRGSKIVNPHSYLRITMDDGTDWVFETQQSGTVLRQLGFTAEMFADGRRVRMSGDAHREGKKIARWRTFSFATDNEADDMDVYLVGRFEDSALVAEIRSKSVSCDNGIESCYRLSGELRAQIEADHQNTLMLW
jgi:hypothetical protein